MVIEYNRSTTVQVDGCEYVYFGGTNYLGLAHRAELLAAATRAFRDFGFSSGASRLTSGENTVLLQLEKELAAFAKAEASLVVPAGYMSNQAVVDGLDQKVDAWVVSNQAHGSIRSAIATSRKPVFLYGGTAFGAGGLRRAFGLSEGETLGIFAEPIEPMSGELFDIASLAQAADARDYIVLDEAHSFGVLGNSGVGALEYFALQGVERLVRTGTFSKALGTSGGFVVAAEEVVEAIKANSGCYKVSTSLSPLACAGTIESLRLIQNEPASTIRKLRLNIERMNRDLMELGMNEYAKNDVPIYHLPRSEKVTLLPDVLAKHGIYIPSVGPYFAESTGLGLRWTIQAGHSFDQLDNLANIIRQYV